jgi:hypothetical protein
VDEAGEEVEVEEDEEDDIRIIDKVVDIIIEIIVMVDMIIGIIDEVGIRIEVMVIIETEEIGDMMIGIRSRISFLEIKIEEGNNNLQKKKNHRPK